MTIDRRTAIDTSASITSPNTVSRSPASFAYSREIYKPFGGLDSVISWCKTETQADWGWQLLQASTDYLPGRYVFYFDSERDYVPFLLKWA